MEALRPVQQPIEQFDSNITIPREQGTWDHIARRGMFESRSSIGLGRVTDEEAFMDLRSLIGDGLVDGEIDLSRMVIDNHAHQFIAFLHPILEDVANSDPEYRAKVMKWAIKVPVPADHTPMVTHLPTDPTDTPQDTLHYRISSAGLIAHPGTYVLPHPPKRISFNAVYDRVKSAVQTQADRMTPDRKAPFSLQKMNGLAVVSVPQTTSEEFKIVLSADILPR